MSPLEQAKREEEKAPRAGTAIEAVLHLVNAVVMYLKVAVVSDASEEWEAAERCARSAATGLDRVADWCSEHRELAEARQRRTN